MYRYILSEIILNKAWNTPNKRHILPKIFDRNSIEKTIFEKRIKHNYIHLKWMKKMKFSISVPPRETFDKKKKEKKLMKSTN